MGMGYTAEYVSSKSPQAIADEMTAISNTRMRRDDQNRKLRAALVEVEKVLALMERTPQEDPDYSTAVQQIGGGVSYGAIMSTSEALWRQLAARNGHEGSEHVHGPARDTVDKILASVRAVLKNS